MTYYRQCNLRRGMTKQVAWIEESLAQLGKYLCIQGEDGWRVERVGKIRKSVEHSPVDDIQFMGW